MKTYILGLRQGGRILCMFTLLSIIIPLQIFGQSTVTIGTGTSTEEFIPVSGYYDYNWASTIYLASEINTSGYISKISYYVDSVANYTLHNQTLFMAHLGISALTSPNYPGISKTQVWTGTLTWNVGWNEIILTTPFYYNGTSNLFIHWENKDGTYSSNYPYFRYTSTSPNNRASYKYSDGAFSTAAGTYSYNRPNIKISLSPLFQDDAGIVA